MKNIPLNSVGEPLGNVSLTEDEFSELILLIDDEPIDEVFLQGIRKKLVAKRKRLRVSLKGES